MIEAGGHTVVLRMDRIDSRPRLEAYEVAVWHKDGHKILLSDNGKISVTCTDFDVTADNITLNGKNGVAVTTPKMSTSEALQVGTRAEIGESMRSATRSSSTTNMMPCNAATICPEASLADAKRSIMKCFTTI